jgi:CxC4 like cysteine cluster associated with KDZ transposases
VRKVAQAELAVSYLPVPPPVWAEIPSDKLPYPRPAPVQTPPPLLTLDQESSCPCMGERTFYRPIDAHFERLCTIYALSRSYQARIQVQSCKVCPPARHHSIGPDPCKLGLFNYNNSIVFTHELLDEYTSAYTTSETPFVAWVAVTARRYAAHGSVFVKEDMFRSVWFAFARLQSFGGDMECLTCGPCPESVIWDGVTLAFGRKHVLDSLEPPTRTDGNSLCRPDRRYFPSQQLVNDRKLRDMVRRVIVAPGLAELLSVQSVEGDVEEFDGDTAPTSEKTPETTKANGAAREKAARAAIDHLGKVELAGQKLQAVNKGLGDLFIKYYGVVAYQNQVQVPRVYRKLLHQV